MEEHQRIKEMIFQELLRTMEIYSVFLHYKYPDDFKNDLVRVHTFYEIADKMARAAMEGAEPRVRHVIDGDDFSDINF